MKWVHSVEAADWIAQWLHPFDLHDVGSVIPTGFAVYAAYSTLPGDRWRGAVVSSIEPKSLPLGRSMMARSGDG